MFPQLLDVKKNKNNYIGQVEGMHLKSFSTMIPGTNNHLLHPIFSLNPKNVATVDDEIVIHANKDFKEKERVIPIKEDLGKRSSFDPNDDALVYHVLNACSLYLLNLENQVSSIFLFSNPPNKKISSFGEALYRCLYVKACPPNLRDSHEKNILFTDIKYDESKMLSVIKKFLGGLTIFDSSDKILIIVRCMWYGLNQLHRPLFPWNLSHLLISLIKSDLPEKKNQMKLITCTKTILLYNQNSISSVQMKCASSILLLWGSIGIENGLKGLQEIADKNASLFFGYKYLDKQNELLNQVETRHFSFLSKQLTMFFLLNCKSLFQASLQGFHSSEVTHSYQMMSEAQDKISDSASDTTQAVFLCSEEEKRPSSKVFIKVGGICTILGMMLFLLKRSPYLMKSS